jgi:iron complex outermembrane receptor protein
VQLNGTINGRVPTGVRGISSVSNEQTVGISSGVAITIDGVPFPSDSFDANNVAGIQSVEVLLGPQSTLGGRTAASGLINLTTRGPSVIPQGFATTTVTDDGEYHVEGFLAGPLMNRLLGSLSVYKSTTQYPITNLNSGDKTTQDVYGGRAKLLFNVTDNLDVTLMAHKEVTQGRGFNFVYAYITPGHDLLFTPGPFTQASLLPGYTPSWNNLVYASPVTTAGATHRDGDYSVIIEDRLPGGYTLTSTSAYSQENQSQTQDLFAVNNFFWNTLTGQTVFYNTQSQRTNFVAAANSGWLVAHIALDMMDRQASLGCPGERVRYCGIRLWGGASAIRGAVSFHRQWERPFDAHARGRLRVEESPVCSPTAWFPGACI